MRFLLDTHVLLWLLAAPERVADTVRRDLATAANTVLVSAVSAMEVATKHRLGRLPEGGPLVRAWDERTAEIGSEPLPLSARHAVLAGTMDWDHRDPFDRMLVAQAVVENVVLVSQDTRIRRVAGLRVLSW